MVNISPPAAPARLAMLERFAGIRGCTLPASALRLLAESLTVTAPELFGAMTELSVHSEIERQPISLEHVRAYLAARRGAVRPTVRAIAALSAKHFGLKLSELTSPTRRRAVVEARNVAIYLARHLAGKSLEQLGGTISADAITPQSSMAIARLRPAPAPIHPSAKQFPNCGKCSPMDSMNFKIHFVCADNVLGISCRVMLVAGYGSTSANTSGPHSE